MNTTIPGAAFPFDPAGTDAKPKQGIRFHMMRGLLTGVAVSAALWVPIGIVASKLF